MAGDRYLPLTPIIAGSGIDESLILPALNSYIADNYAELESISRLAPEAMRKQLHTAVSKICAMLFMSLPIEFSLDALVFIRKLLIDYVYTSGVRGYSLPSNYFTLSDPPDTDVTVHTPSSYLNCYIIALVGENTLYISSPHGDIFVDDSDGCSIWDKFDGAISGGRLGEGVSIDRFDTEVVLTYSGPVEQVGSSVLLNKPPITVLFANAQSESTEGEMRIHMRLSSRSTDMAVSKGSTTIEPLTPSTYEKYPRPRHSDSMVHILASLLVDVRSISDKTQIIDSIYANRLDTFAPFSTYIYSSRDRAPVARPSSRKSRDKEEVTGASILRKKMFDDPATEMLESRLNDELLAYRALEETKSRRPLTFLEQRDFDQIAAVLKDGEERMAKRQATLIDSVSVKASIPAMSKYDDIGQLLQKKELLELRKARLVEGSRGRASMPNDGVEMLDEVEKQILLINKRIKTLTGFKDYFHHLFTITETDEAQDDALVEVCVRITLPEEVDPTVVSADEFQEALDILLKEAETTKAQPVDPEDLDPTPSIAPDGLVTKWELASELNKIVTAFMFSGQDHLFMLENYATLAVDKLGYMMVSSEFDRFPVTIHNHPYPLCTITGMSNYPATLNFQYQLLRRIGALDKCYYGKAGVRGDYFAVHDIFNYMGNETHYERLSGLRLVPFFRFKSMSIPDFLAKREQWSDKRKEQAAMIRDLSINAVKLVLGQHFIPYNEQDPFVEDGKNDTFLDVAKIIRSHVYNHYKDLTRKTTGKIPKMVRLLSEFLICRSRDVLNLTYLIA